MVRDSIALDPWPITAGPDNFVIVVAGGGHPTNSYWLQGYSPGVVGRVIEVPPAFEGLLADGAVSWDDRLELVEDRAVRRLIVLKVEEMRLVELQPDPALPPRRVAFDDTVEDLLRLQV